MNLKEYLGQFKSINPFGVKFEGGPGSGRKPGDNWKQTHPLQGMAEEPTPSPKHDSNDPKFRALRDAEDEPKEKPKLSKNDPRLWTLRGGPP